MSEVGRNFFLMRDIIVNRQQLSDLELQVDEDLSRVQETKLSILRMSTLSDGNWQDDAWHECNEPARPRSKYCSRNCSNKNARARHKTRGKS